MPEKAGEQKYYQTLLKRSQSWLVALLHQGSLNAAERSAAGNALASLGDPRFDASTYFLPHGERLGFLEVPAGPFIMGSDPKKDKYAGEEEQPQHELYLPAFYIARYPVTVAQFRAFTEDSGTKPETEYSLRGLANHPVVGVTWYEALTYCQWLTERLQAQAQHRMIKISGQVQHADGFWSGLAEGKVVVSLPSEAEWEKAARGADGRIYPWSGDFDPDKANTDETGLNATSPVGGFPHGASPYEALDMSGNVWQWTRSLWGENWEKSQYGYPYQRDDGREHLKADRKIPRVLRGGSFISYRRLARCAFRGGASPGYRQDSVGFRVVVSPYVSEL